MNRNGLTDQTGALINIGLIQSRQVTQFVEGMSGLDGTFLEQIDFKGFVSEYQRQVEEGLEGDSLFEAMQVFSTSRKIRNAISECRAGSLGLPV